MNVVRNAVIKAAEENQNESEKARFKAALNPSKYALLKLEEQLTQKQQIKLSEVKAVSPLLANMHQQQSCI